LTLNATYGRKALGKAAKAPSHDEDGDDAVGAEFLQQSGDRESASGSDEVVHAERTDALEDDVAGRVVGLSNRGEKANARDEDCEGHHVSFRCKRDEPDARMTRRWL
jgi:hypothetical protein